MFMWLVVPNKKLLQVNSRRRNYELLKKQT